MKDKELTQAPRIARTHDQFYLHENRYDHPKEMFRFVGQLVKDCHQDSGTSPLTICDFGCAAGEFPYYLRKTFPCAVVEGYELLDVLLEKARSAVPDVNFFQGPILEKSCCSARRSDISCALGVLSIFDSFEPVIENLIYWTKAGGRIFLHGLFNPYPVDVNIKYSHSRDYGKGSLESGWNIFSKESVSRFLDGKQEVSNYSFHDFNISVDIPPNENDCVRSWTVQTISGTKQITNGLCIVQPHSILEIEIQQG